MGKRKARREKRRSRTLSAGRQPSGQSERPDQPTRADRPERVHSSRVLDFYDREYKKLLIIPFMILFLAIGQIAFQYATTGDFMNKGVSLQGGTTVTVPSDGSLDPAVLEAGIRAEFPQNDINIRVLRSAGAQIGIIIEADISEKEETDRFIEGLERLTGKSSEEFGVDVIGSSLGGSFFRQTIISVAAAFVLMGIVVFLYFRTFVPSIAVILAAASDIIVTLAVVNLLGIKLSTAGIAAFLMLIGYSIDTDILLSTRVLKRKGGTVFERVMGAMKTGLTMNLTTMAALIVALLMSRSEVLSQIMTIILIGLVVDIINTWIQNVGLLRIYLERRKSG